MDNIALPELLSITINNFSLYPNGLNYKYEFIKGVNLVVGGNGMGKTTFVNLIKFGLIGNYKKSFDFTRTYKGEKIEKRLTFPNDYFRKRIDKTIIMDQNPSVTLEFLINEAHFIVTRDLSDLTLTSFFVNGVEIKGSTISQEKYEKLADDKKIEYLNFKYEEEITKYFGLSFDDLIFFTNEILYFGEDHKTILWSDGFDSNDVQNELFNKYFNDKEIDNKRQESKREQKYFDSLARHNSEDIRAISKILTEIEKQNNKVKTSVNELLETKKIIEKFEEKKEDTFRSANRINNEVKVLVNKKNRLTKEINSNEARLNQLKANAQKQAWEQLHDKYNSFEKNILQNHKCPLCNKESEMLYARIKENPSNCLMCGNSIDSENSIISNFEFMELDKKNEQLLKDLHNIIKNEKDYEKKLEENDFALNKINIQLRSLKDKLRNLEYSQSNESGSTELHAIKTEIDRLELSKADNLRKSKAAEENVKDYSRLIEEKITEHTNHFSQLFSKFAESFLSVKCSLTYDSYETEHKRYYPVIGDAIRYNEEELSESQRFFVDHAFRMSILSFFYLKPAFYIVETPDSSLDISYEKNAAKVFINFLKNPYVIILTSNLNNSSFIEHIIDNSDGINCKIIDLVSIAKKSSIQSSDEKFQHIYQNLKRKAVSS